MPGKEQTCAGEDGFSVGPVGKQFGSQRNPARVHWMRFQELNSINRRQRQKHKNKRRGARRTLFSANHGCWVFFSGGRQWVWTQNIPWPFFLLFFFSSPRFAMKGFSPPFYFQPTLFYTSKNVLFSAKCSVTQVLQKTSKTWTFHGREVLLYILSFSILRTGTRSVLDGVWRRDQKKNTRRT